MVILANTTYNGAQEVINRFVGALFKDITIDVGSGKRFPVTVSFGASGVDVVPAEGLLQDADRRMYEAKQSYYESQKRYR